MTTSQGSGVLFARTGTSRSQEGKFFASDGAEMDTFGISTAIDDGWLIVGASGDSIGAAPAPRYPPLRWLGQGHPQGDSGNGILKGDSGRDKLFGAAGGTSSLATGIKDRGGGS